MSTLLFAVLVLAGKLAYVHNGNIWVKTLPDGGAIQLSQSGDAASPQWSRSGHWLTFQQKGKVIAVSVDGERHEIAADHAAWSSQYDELAFLDTEGLRTVRFDGSTMRNRVVLRHSHEAQISGFAWNPDASAFAVSVISPDPGGRPEFRVGHLWRVNSDGTQAQEIFTPKDQGGVVPIGWSSDGQYVLVQFDPDFSASLAADGLALLSVPVYGGTAHELASNVLPHKDFLSIVSERREILVVDGAGRETWRNKRLTLIDPATGKRDYVTDEKSVVVSASWSPDGTQIAYVTGPDERPSEHQTVGSVVLPNGRISSQVIRVPDSSPQTLVNQRRIWIVGSDGKPRQLTSDPLYRDEYPVWSADGQTICFIRVDQQDRATLWGIDLISGALRKLLDDPGTVTPKNAWFGYYGHFDWYKEFAPSEN